MQITKHFIDHALGWACCKLLKIVTTMSISVITFVTIGSMMDPTLSLHLGNTFFSLLNLMILSFWMDTPAIQSLTGRRVFLVVVLAFFSISLLTRPWFPILESLCFSSIPVADDTCSSLVNTLLSPLPLSPVHFINHKLWFTLILSTLPPIRSAYSRLQIFFQLFFPLYSHSQIWPTVKGPLESCLRLLLPYHHNGHVQSHGNSPMDCWYGEEFKFVNKYLCFHLTHDPPFIWFTSNEYQGLLWRKKWGSFASSRCEFLLLLYIFTNSFLRPLLPKQASLRLTLIIILDFACYSPLWLAAQLFALIPSLPNMKRALWTLSTNRDVDGEGFQRDINSLVFHVVNGVVFLCSPLSSSQHIIHPNF